MAAEAVSAALAAAVLAAAEPGEAGRICDLRFAIVDLGFLSGKFVFGSLSCSNNY